MRNLGTFDGGIVSRSGGAGHRGIARFNDSRTVRTFKDASIANGGVFLQSELEKRDQIIRQPLTSVTYTRDIPIKVGGGWVEYVSAMNIDFGTTGGSGDGTVTASGANGIPVIQMNMEKDTFSAHVFSTILRVPFIDMQRQQLTGKSLDALLTDGVRLSYDKHMDRNVYMGIASYGTHGLLNNPNITVQNAALNAGGTARDWKHKTPDEILNDINDAINTVWEACGNDASAIPNHVIIPHEHFAYIATQKVSQYADKSILTYLLENNVTKLNGYELVIAPCPWCKNAGVGNVARMAVYVHNERFLAVEELVPLARSMTQPNVQTLSYDSVYTANISEVELFYNQTVLLVDGI